MSGKMMEAGEENGASRAREYSDRYWEAYGGMLLEREVERASIIASLVPEDSNSVLEVGCGDGLIINMVTGTGRETMGLDLSESGIKGVRGPATLGSVSELPFEDASWDAVIASEVIEHIPEEDYRRSLREIGRVSRSCIIVSVPNNENFERNMTKCPRCGTKFHAYYHVRSYCHQDLDGLFTGFKLSRCFDGGAHARTESSIELFFKHKVLDRWIPFGSTVCPFCGYSGHEVVSGALTERSGGTGRDAARKMARLLPFFNRTRPKWTFAVYSADPV